MKTRSVRVYALGSPAAFCCWCRNDTATVNMTPEAARPHGLLADVLGRIRMKGIRLQCDTRPGAGLAFPRCHSPVSSALSIW
jgi:hypothetical protein